MGTNYYLIKEQGEICKCCGRGESSTRLHIGKSSVGWCFSVHVIPEDGIKNLDDWKLLFEQGKIEDEYGTSLSSVEMMKVITERSFPRKDKPLNLVMEGPNGLSRHKYTYAHGEGTWDYCTGDFS